MARYLANRDGGKTNEEGLYKFLEYIFPGEVLTNTSLQVTQQASPALGITVATGAAKIPSGNNYPYMVWQDATQNLSITTADATNPRRDLVVAYVDLAEVSTATSNNSTAFKLAVVAGTPNSSPSDPNDTAIHTVIGALNPYIILARVAVAANDTTITNSEITDLRKISAIAYRAAQHYITTDEATTATSPSDLATVGPTVDLVVGDSGTVRFTIGATIYNNTTGQFVNAYLTASGANTISANGRHVLRFKVANSNSDLRASYTDVITGLTPGLTTFKIMYAVSGGTGRFYDRALIVEAL